MGLPDPPGENNSGAHARYDAAVECLVGAVRRIADPEARKAAAVRASRSAALSNYRMLELLAGYSVLDGQVRDAVCERDWGDALVLVSPDGELGEVLEDGGRWAADRDETAGRFGFPFVGNVF